MGGAGGLLISLRLLPYACSRGSRSAARHYLRPQREPVTVYDLLPDQGPLQQTLSAALRLTLMLELRSAGDCHALRAACRCGRVAVWISAVMPVIC
jgi:hypothetical protein